MVLSLVVFVVVSLLAFLVALLFVEGVIWPAVIGVFCGFAAATVLNATDSRAGGRDDQRENGRVP